MKTIYLLAVTVFCSITVWSQNTIPLIGSKAPSFEANTTNGKLVFPEDFGNNWKILFSHPRDFTPVCTSEVYQLSRMQEEFDSLGVKIAVISTDEISDHERWKESIESINQEGKEPVIIKFPIIDDFNAKVSELYGMIHEGSTKGSRSVKDVRGVFIIDPNNIIQVILFYPMKVGRNMEEIKRTVIALQTVNVRVSTPVNWKPGDDVLTPVSPYLDVSVKDKTEIPNQYYKVGDIMWYKKIGH